MPRASKRKLNPDIELQINNEFINLISTLHTTHETYEFLINFLTPEEKVMLSKRLMLHIMLEKHYKTSNIQNVLLMSRDTIQHHKKSWLVGGLTYRQILKKLIKRANTRAVLKKVEGKISFLELSKKSKSKMRGRIRPLISKTSKNQKRNV